MNAQQGGEQSSLPRAARARMIVGRVLPLIRSRGRIERLEKGPSYLSCNIGPFKFGLMTPFSGSEGTPVIRSYQEAAAYQRFRKPLPYRLDIWCEKKVMSAEWEDGGEFHLISMTGGAWEDEALNLT